MKSKQRILAAMLTLCIALAASPASAMTFTQLLDGASYESYSGSLSGNHLLTGLYSETSNTISLMTDSGATVLTKSPWSSVPGVQVSVADLANTYFSISGQPSVDITDAAQVKVYQLLADFTLNGYNLSSGSLIIGLEDTNNSGGGFDYNDMVFAARNTAATPIPPAALLLGSGVLGMFGLSRARRNRQR